MDNSLVALVLPPMLIVPAMGLLSRFRSTTPLGRELRRKALHIGIGLAALAFPYLLTQPWMVVTAFGAVTAWMICVRRIDYLRCRFGCVLHDAGRESHGELYFAIALAWLLIADHAGPFQYVVPLLILTVSDAAAAIVGRSRPIGRYAIFGNSKSMSGSAAFLVTAFAITAASLSMGTGLPIGQVLLMSTKISLATAFVEAVSTRGLDNLSVPLVAWLFLSSLTYGA
jgi:phytol kinase